MWNTVELVQFGCKIRLAGTWWPSDEHLEWEEAAEIVELLVQHRHGFAVDTGWALPFEAFQEIW